jgi:hypothetical protein
MIVLQFPQLYAEVASDIREPAYVGRPSADFMKRGEPG